MKEIAYEVGRIALLVPPEQVTPLRGFYAPEAFAAIAKRYGFQSTPDLSVPAERLQKEGLRFRLGKVPGKEANRPTASINDFVIFQDGFVVDGYVTDDAEMFIADLMKWGKESLGIRDFSHPPRQGYLSQVTVQFEPSVNKLIKQFDDIATLLTSLLMKTYRLNTVVELQGVRFDYDKLTAPNLYNLVQFTIERKAGHKYEDGLFWCQAPLRTTDHIQLLKTIETLLSK
jgi:hypothetical protein